MRGIDQQVLVVKAQSGAQQTQSGQVFDGDFFDMQKQLGRDALPDLGRFDHRRQRHACQALQ